jgi:hypothetical protein
VNEPEFLDLRWQRLRLLWHATRAVEQVAPVLLVQAFPEVGLLQGIGIGHHLDENTDVLADHELCGRPVFYPQTAEITGPCIRWIPGKSRVTQVPGHIQSPRPAGVVS